MPSGKLIVGDCVDVMARLAGDGEHFDLCLTDPPYNLGFSGKKHSKNKNFYHDDGKTYYSDKRDDYMEWCERWFSIVEDLCTGTVLTPGYSNLFSWVRMREPGYTLKGWYKSNTVNYQNFDPILLYGKIPNINKWGPPIWNRVVRTVKKIDVNHPCPKNYGLWREILARLDPASVLDPFLGSGTTAQACEELGIDWVGIEIEEDYVPVINQRVELGRRKGEKPW